MCSGGLWIWGLHLQPGGIEDYQPQRRGCGQWGLPGRHLCSFSQNAPKGKWSVLLTHWLDLSDPKLMLVLPPFVLACAHLLYPHGSWLHAGVASSDHVTSFSVW